MSNRRPINPQKYILAFIFSALIFALGFLLSAHINNRRLAEINVMRQMFQVQVLALETQLSHFKEMLCPDIGADILTHELHLIGERLQFMAENLGKNHPEVLTLQKYYSLLQIRHYQLSVQINQRCNLGLAHVLYFFSDPRNCPDCEQQGRILSFLRQEHSRLRVYSFNYHLDLPALAVIKPLSPNENGNQDNRLPLIIVDKKPYWGLKNIQEMKVILPDHVFER